MQSKKDAIPALEGRIKHRRTLRDWVEILAASLRVTKRDMKPNARTAAKLTLMDLVRMLKRNFQQVNKLWLAARIADEVGYERAIQFARRHADAVQLPGVNILCANASVGKDDLWLRYVNQYLEGIGMAPIGLSAAPGTLFARLQAAPSTVTVDGDLISVIMPAFNAGNFIIGAARSILEQSWRNLELIIVDDCSTDNTWEIVRMLAESDPRVKALRNVVNVGPYVSKNLALRVARGRYITGQDADDWSHPHRLQNDMRVLLEGRGRIKATLSMMLRMRENGHFFISSQRARQRGSYVVDGIRRPACISLLIEADYLYKYLGGWDSVRFGADSELISRIDKVMGDSFQWTSHVGMFCRDLDTSLTNHPVYGVSKTTGMSPVRRQYLAAYLAWHEGLDRDGAKLPFPHIDRRYDAPEPMRVPLDAIQKNIASHARYCSAVDHS